MKKEFVMRGQTASGQTEILNFSGHKPGMAYRLTEFSLYPSSSILSSNAELSGTLTAGKTAMSATDPDFSEEGLIGTAFVSHTPSHEEIASKIFVINDTYLITQNLILKVQDSQSNPINWQCRFEPVKMTGAEEAVTNYKQYLISDGS